MTTVRDITKHDDIGREKLQGLLGVGYKSITKAEADNLCPARWAPIIKAECERVGLDCPDTLFNFIRPQEVST